MFAPDTFRKNILNKTKKYDIAGLSVAVTDAREILFSEGFGVESVERPLLSVGPDTRYKIASNTKMLAASLAEKLTGEIFSSLVSRLVLQPLGMTHTHYYFRDAATYPWALPHVKKENGALAVRHTVSSIETRFGSGEVFSTPEDLCRIARLLMRGGVADSGERILSETSVREMLSRQVVRDDGGYHGLGIHIRPEGEGFVYGHTGTLNPYRSAMFFNLEKCIGVSVMLNTNAPTLRDEIVSSVFA